MERLASGIAGFDAIVQGGLPAETSLVLQGPPGQEKLAFALAFLAEGLRNGDSGLVVIASQSPESLLRDLRRYGVDIERVVKEDRLRIVDWFSWSEETVTDVEERGAVVRSAVDLTAAGAAVSRAIVALRGEGQRRAFVEMLSPAVNVYDVGQVYAFAQSTKRKLDRFHFTALFLLENEMHSPAVLTTLHQPFDGVIEIERSRSGDRIVRKIGVLHLKDTTPPPDFVPFEFTDQGIRIDGGTPAPPPPPAPAVPQPEPEPSEIRRPSELRATRIGMIQEIARERLRIDPEDRDALFTLAAAQAIADDPRSAVRTLERLETIDPGYPGLWAFEMKLFARLGDAERWQRSRQKALDSSKEPGGEGANPCPFCKAPVSVGSAQCPHCMADLREETDLFRGLEDLVRVTVQEMVQEEQGTKPSPEPEAVRPEPAVKGPGLKPVPKGKGLTNGLVLERRALRPISTTKAGDRTGLRGRTNGLTNGLRGRTNGLTNGLGRTNGLTNGLRGRTNGLTNGLGRTNGLTNGLGRTNGLTNGLGRTNGLTNGVGRTNGLTNGLGRVAQRRGLFGRSSTPRWQRILLPVAVVVLLLLLPIALFWTGPAPTYPIQIDGQFADWSGVAKITTPPPAQLSPDIDITRVAVRDNVDYTAFYVEVAGDPFAGGPAPQRITNTFYAFLDTDGSAATGYRVQGIGADRMIRVDTWGGSPVGASLFEFDGTRTPQDWNGWVRIGPVAAAGSGSRLEFEARRIDLGTAGAMEVAFASRGWNGESDAADVIATDAVSFLLLAQATAAPQTVRSSADVLSTLTLTGVGGPMTLTGITVTFQGTFTASSLSWVSLVDSSGALLTEQPPAGRVHFPLGAYLVPANGTRALTVRATVLNPDGSTLGAFVAAPEDVEVGSGGVGMVSPINGPASLAYVGTAPSGVRIDGGFADWANVTSDPVGDVQPIWDSDIDLSAYSLQGSAGSSYFTARVVGAALNGTLVPALNPAYTPPTNGSSNGTVGPRPPPVNGTDYLLFYLDEDGSTATGYRVGGMGADYLVQITGKGGEILSSLALKFNGTSAWDWSWTQIGTAASAKAGNQVEASLAGVAVTNASRAFFEARGWNQAMDSSLAPAGPTALSVTSLAAASSGPSTTAAPTLGPGRLVAQDIPGNQKWFFTSTVLSGGGAPTVCTSNLAASTTAGSSPTTNTLTNGSASVCWYTPTGTPSSTNAGAWEMSLDISGSSSTLTPLPNADGALNQWAVGGSCLAGSEYTCVNQDPNDGNTTYVTTSATNKKSTFALSDWASPPNPVNITSVTISVWCWASTGSGQPGKVSTILLNGSLENDGTSTACSTGAYGVITTTYSQYPAATPRAWTSTDINNLQAGVLSSGTKTLRVTEIKVTVAYMPSYSVEIDLCTNQGCTARTALYGPVTYTTFGSNVTVTTPSIAAQTLNGNDRLRFAVTWVSGPSVTISYNGPNPTPGTSDSRATVPIPEFQDVLMPVLGAIVLTIILPARRRRQARAANAEATQGVVPRH